MRTNEQTEMNDPNTPVSLGEALRELGRQFKVGFSEALAAAKAEQAARTGAAPVPGPKSRLTAEEEAKLERLLRTMPWRDHGDLPA